MARGGTSNPERIAKLVAGGMRAKALKRKRLVEIVEFRNTSPAIWVDVHHHIGDCQYVDDGVDDTLIRAVHERLVFAHSLTCHRSAPFEDVVVKALAEITRANCVVDQKARTVKKKPRRIGGPKPIPSGALGSFRHKPPAIPVARHKTPAITVGRALVDIVDEAKLTGYRTGRTLEDVVNEMFPT